jgi:hypothetical protein
MRLASRVLTASVAILVICAIAVGSAAALRSLSLSPGGEFTAAIPNLRLRGNNGTNLICNVTLRGTLVRPAVIEKRAGAAVGGITEGRGSNERRTCRESAFESTVRVTVLAERNRPIALTYVAILGTLPAITGVLIEAARGEFRIDTEICTALYQGPVGVLIAFDPATGASGAIKFLEERSVRARERTGFGCPETGTFEGRGSLTPVQTIFLL